MAKACKQIKSNTGGERRSQLKVLTGRQLRLMSENDHVLVDSSAVCAIVHDCTFSLVQYKNSQTAALIHKFEEKMFPKNGNGKASILFRKKVKMSLREVIGVFGDIKDVPIGTVMCTA